MSIAHENNEQSFPKSEKSIATERGFIFMWTCMLIPRTWLCLDAIIEQEAQLSQGWADLTASCHWAWRYPTSM